MLKRKTQPCSYEWARMFAKNKKRNHLCKFVFIRGSLEDFFQTMGTGGPQARTSLRWNSA
ncbi:MAG: hypothetical protein KatS3mg123_1841 [Burkholderiales bacterium]|nr:MAG: hypothetical protein KatS3mg123_1841 [Burkholderiales bacterium]